MTSSPQARDARVDFWRGFALVTIFVSHIPGTIFETWTHGNFGFSDAAEVFVLLAGVSSAYAYLRKFRGGERGSGLVAPLFRAFSIYSAHLVTLVAAIALITSVLHREELGRLVDDYLLEPLVSDPLGSVRGLATLGYQLHYFNILPLYVALLALVPLLVLLSRRRLVPALLVSLSLYVATHLFALRLPAQTEAAWHFNPLAWQLLFTVGFALAAASAEGRRVGFRPVLFALALVYLKFALVVSLSRFELPRTADSPLGFLWTMDKRNLSLPRLVHVLALAYVVAYAPGFASLRHLPRGNPLTLLGRHSLPVFCFGSLLSVAGHIGKLTTSGRAAFDLLYIALGVALQVALAAFLEWRKLGYPRLGRAEPPRDAAP